MFHRFQRFFTQVKVLLDVAMLALAFGLAYTTRFWSPRFIPFVAPSPWNNTIRMLSTILLLYPLALRGLGLYRAGRIRSFMDELFGIFKAWLLASMAVVTITYFFQPVRYSRLVLGLFFLLSFALLAIERYAFRALMHVVRRRGYNLKDVLVVGAGELAARVVETLHGHRELGFRLVGLLASSTAQQGTDVQGAPVIGTLADLPEVLRSRTVDQVVIALPLEEWGALRELMVVLSESTADVKVVPDLLQYITLASRSSSLEEFGGLPLLSLQGDPLQGWNSVLKRLFDLIFSALALVATSPLVAVGALLVRIEGRGPVFYRQERMGLDGELFHIIKLRTMFVGAESAGPRMASARDPRVTRSGSLLRRLSIDELPQLWNVLRGDMSLVGPRPERPVFIEAFRRQIPRYHLRHKVKAGLTGWAQINGLRGQTSIQKRIEFDLYYIENWSMLLDLKILIRTVAGGFLSKNAY